MDSDSATCVIVWIRLRPQLLQCCTCRGIQEYGRHVRWKDGEQEIKHQKGEIPVKAPGNVVVTRRYAGTAGYGIPYGRPFVAVGGGNIWADAALSAPRDDAPRGQVPGKLGQGLQLGLRLRVGLWLRLRLGLRLGLDSTSLSRLARSAASTTTMRRLWKAEGEGVVPFALTLRFCLSMGEASVEEQGLEHADVVVDMLEGSSEGRRERTVRCLEMPFGAARRPGGVGWRCRLGSRQGGGADLALEVAVEAQSFSSSLLSTSIACHGGPVKEG